jgi:hypothetical protein
MNTSYPTRKSSAFLLAPSLLRGAAIHLGLLVVASALILVTGAHLTAVFALRPASLLSPALVGLGVGATLAGAAALAAYATPLGREIVPMRSSLAILLVDGLLAGLVSGMLFQVALQPLVGIVAAAALYALLELLFRRFPLFSARRWESALAALALGVGFGLLYQRFGLAAALAAQAGFRVIFLLLVGLMQ